jgi:hypothetical protein
MLTRLASTVCASALVAFLLAAAPIAPERAAATGIGVNGAPAADTTLGTAAPAPGGSTQGGSTLAPRQVRSKQSSSDIELPIDPITRKPQWNGRLGVKFRDDLRVRADLVPTDFVRSNVDGMPIPAVTELLRTVGGTVRQMLRRSPEELRQLEMRAERKSKQAQPDLASMVYIDVTPDQLLATARAFNDLDIVEWIEIERNQVLHGGDVNQSPQYGCGTNGEGTNTGINNCYTASRHTAPNFRCSTLGGNQGGCNNVNACNEDPVTIECISGCSDPVCCGIVANVIPYCSSLEDSRGWDAVCATYANILCGGTVYDSEGPSGGASQAPSAYKYDPCFALRGPFDFTSSTDIAIQGSLATWTGTLEVTSQLLTCSVTGDGAFIDGTVAVIPYPNSQTSDEGDSTTGVPQQAIADPSLEGAYLAASGGCFTSHTTRGCSQVSCCVWVCRNDPYCCTNSWDDNCVVLAQNLEVQAGPGGPNDTPCTPQTLPGSCPFGVATGPFPTCESSETPDLTGGPIFAGSGLPIPNSARGFQIYKTKEAVLAPLNTLPTGLTYPVELPTVNSDSVPGTDDRTNPETNLGTLAMLNSTFRGGGLDIAGFERVAGQLLLPPKTAVNSCHGEGITVAVIEPSAFLEHEELVGRVTGEPNQTQILVVSPPLDPNHGTAVLGVIGARKGPGTSTEEEGISGIAYKCEMRFYPSVSREEGQRVANALTTALIDLEEGDIITMAIGQGGSSTGGGALRGDTILVSQSIFDLVQLGSQVGITTVVSAGNDSAPVRTAPPGGADTGALDSGAIVVGGCWPGYQAGRFNPADPATGTPATTLPQIYPGQNYCRMAFSNFTDLGDGTTGGGGRVDVAGWGTAVASIGYGDLWKGDSPNLDPLQANNLRTYTANFNGTSASAAMIAGWAACVQGFSKAYWGAPQGAGTLRDAICKFDANLNGIRNVYPQCGGADANPGGFPGYPEDGDARAGDWIRGGQVALIGGFPNCTATTSYIVSNTFGGAPTNLTVVTGTLQSGNSFSLREQDGAAVSVLATNKRAGSKGQAYGSPLFYPLTGATTDLQLQLLVPQSPSLVTGISVDAFSKTSWNLPVIGVFYVYNWKQRRWQGIGNTSLTQAGTAVTFSVPGAAQDYAISSSSGGSTIYARVYTCGLGSNTNGYTVLHDLLRLRPNIDGVFNPGNP